MAGLGITWQMTSVPSSEHVAKRLLSLLANLTLVTENYTNYYSQLINNLIIGNKWPTSGFMVVKNMIDTSKSKRVFNIGSRVWGFQSGWTIYAFFTRKHCRAFKTIWIHSWIITHRYILESGTISCRRCWARSMNSFADIFTPVIVKWLRINAGGFRVGTGMTVCLAMDTPVLIKLTILFKNSKIFNFQKSLHFINIAVSIFEYLCSQI